jgi:hypothetical protein
MRYIILLLGLILAFTPSYVNGQESQTIGAWTIVSSVDPLTDSRITTAMVNSDDPRGGLGIRCINTELTVIWIVGNYLGDNRSVTMRFGEGDVRATNWRQTASRDVLIHPNSSQFMQQIATVPRLILRVTTPLRTVTHLFDVTGSDEVVTILGRVCNTRVAN